MKSEIKMKKTNDRKKDIRREEKGLRGSIPACRQAGVQWVLFVESKIPNHKFFFTAEKGVK